MTHKNQDIDVVLEELGQADVVANNAETDVIIREDILRGFISRCAEPLVALLNELKLRREQTEDSVLPISTHRVIVEGFSDESTEKALAMALDKAAPYFTEEHDVSLTLKQLVELPEGGHRATIEVHLTPFTLRPKPHVQPIEIEHKHQHQADFDKFRVQESTYAKHLVFDHFARSNGAISAGLLPEFFMIHVNDANLMNYMLEKQFFKAGHHLKNSPAPKAFTVKLSPELNDD